MKTTLVRDGTPPTSPNHASQTATPSSQRAYSHFGNGQSAFEKRTTSWYVCLSCITISLPESNLAHPYTHPQVYGDFEMCLESDERVFAYVRKLGHVRAWVVLNFSADVVEVPFGTTEDGPGLGLPLGVETGRGGDPELVLCNYDAASGPPGMDSETGTLMLRGYEARVYISSSSFLTT